VQVEPPPPARRLHHRAGVREPRRRDLPI
jgi:hypothetical protein